MCPHTCVTNLPKPRQKQPGQRLHYLKRIMIKMGNLGHDSIKSCCWHQMIGTVGLCSGCRSCFDAGWQLGGWKAHRPSYRPRVGGGGGPGPDPKGTFFHWPWITWGTSFAKTNRTAKNFKDQENRSSEILFQHIVKERGSGRIFMFWILKPGQVSEDSRPVWTVGPQCPTGTWLLI